MKHYNEPDPGDRPSTRVSTDGLVLPPARAGSSGSCDLYDPGHQIHYKHQARAAGSTPRTVRDALLEGTLLTLQLEDGEELEWRHHDPQRLRRILELEHGRGAAYPHFHVLRLGPYWFNCARQSDPWQACPLSVATEEE
jgi:hypothetical protein